MNKASGGDGIPAELFQILNDDATKVLLSICQQIWKTQQVNYMHLRGGILNFSIHFPVGMIVNINLIKGRSLR